MQCKILWNLFSQILIFKWELNGMPIHHNTQCTNTISPRGNLELPVHLPVYFWVEPSILKLCSNNNMQHLTAQEITQHYIYIGYKAV